MTESAVRQLAGRRGFRVLKSRRRNSGDRDDQGGYCLVDDRGYCVLGDQYDATLEEIAEYVRDYEAVPSWR